MANIEIKGKKLMIGGQALLAIGNTRHTDDTDYLVNVPGQGAFMHDKAANEDYCNAAGNKFFAEVWKMEKGNIGPLSSPAALLELKAYAFVQHCLNHHFSKADHDEADMKFLFRKFNLPLPKIVKKHVTAGEYSEIEKIFDAMRR